MWKVKKRVLICEEGSRVRKGKVFFFGNGCFFGNRFVVFWDVGLDVIWLGKNLEFRI